MRKSLKLLIAVMLILTVAVLGFACKEEEVIPTVTGIELDLATFKTSYTVDSALDLTGTIIKVTKSDDTTEPVAVQPSMVTGFTTAASGNYTVTVTYEGFSQSVHIVVREAFTNVMNSVPVPFRTITYRDGEVLSELLQAQGDVAIKLVTEGTGLSQEDCRVLAQSQIEYLDLTDATFVGSMVERNAFEGYAGLKGITLPNTITTIRENAFLDCTGLSQLVIPDSVTTIEGNPTVGCVEMRQIYCSASNSKFLSVSGVLYDNAKKDLRIYPTARANAEYSVLSGATTISASAFDGVQLLQKVTLPASMREIRQYAFHTAGGLQSIALNTGLVTIGQYAFSQCRALESISLPTSLQILEQGAFADCDRLAAVSMPDNLNTLSANVFKNCVSLTSFELGRVIMRADFSAFSGCTALAAITVHASNMTFSEIDGVVYSADKTVLHYYPEGKPTEDGVYMVRDTTATIKGGAFTNTSLTTISIPASVTSIEDNAFIGNSQLSAFVVSGDQQSFTAVDGVLYSRDESILYSYPQGKLDVANYTILPTVGTVRPNAFRGAQGIVELVIDCPMTTLLTGAFAGMTGLRKVTIGSRITSVGTDAFLDCDNLDIICVNGSSLAFSAYSIPVENGVALEPNANSEYDFYGWFNTTIGGDCLINAVDNDEIPNRLLNSAIVEGGITLYPRYGNYAVAISTSAKEGNDLNFYTVVSTQEDIQLMHARIAASVNLIIEYLDGRTETVDMSQEYLTLPGNYASATVVNIGVTYKHLTSDFDITLKARDNFTVTYSAGTGGKFRLYSSTSGAATLIVNQAYEYAEGTAQAESMGLFAEANEGYEFIGYVISEPQQPKRSAYFTSNDISTTYVVSGRQFRLTELMCDLVVSAVFKPLFTVSASNSQSIEGHPMIGGTVSMEGGVSGVLTAEQQVVRDEASVSFIARPYLTFPTGSAGYESNPSGVFGYYFDRFVLQVGNNPESLAVFTYLPNATEYGYWSYTRAGYIDSIVPFYDQANGVYVQNTYTIATKIDGVMFYDIVELLVDVQDSDISAAYFKVHSIQSNLHLNSYYIPYYSLTYTAGDGGIIAMGEERDTVITQYIKHGDDAVTVQANPADCYAFVEWSHLGESISVDPRKSDTEITASDEYFAGFKSLIPTEYVRISTPEGLAAMSADLTGNYILTCDLDMTGYEWMPLGDRATSEYFSGMLDGQGYTISNLTMDSTGDDVGFFGVFCGEVRNVNFHNVTILLDNKTTTLYVGAIVGFMKGGSISACTVQGLQINVSTSATACAGGLAGMVSDGVVSNSILSGEMIVSGSVSASVGGLVGSVNNGYVFNSLSVARMYSKSSANQIGGLAGGMIGSTMTDCVYDKTVAETVDPLYSMYTKASKAVASAGAGTEIPNNYAMTTEELYATEGMENWLDVLWQFEAGAYPTLATNVETITITNEDELLKIFNYPSGNYVLGADIQLTKTWTPVPFFSGSIDGGGHTIYGMEILDCSGNIGMFAQMGAGAVVKNLALKDLYIESYGGTVSIGGITGVQHGGIIFGVTVNGAISVHGTVTAHIGGIVGIIDVGGAINNSYSLMTIKSVNGQDDKIGGIVGLIKQGAKNANIKYCFSASVLYSENNLTSKAVLGGVIGSSASSSTLIQDNFYILDNIYAIDETYIRPTTMFGFSEVSESYELIADNKAYHFAQIPAEPFDGWDSSLWEYVKGLIPHLYFEQDFFIPDIDENNGYIGTGVKSSPYQISTYQQLKWLKTFNLQYYVLGADIDCAGEVWEPFVFGGGIDGNGHCITNLSITKSKQGGAALFSELSGKAALTNLNLLNVNYELESANNVAVAGIALRVKGQAVITNCSVTGVMKANSTGGSVTGGAIVAEMVSSKNVKNCFSYIRMELNAPEGTVNAGGIAGYVIDSTISDCFSAGTIRATGAIVNLGGIAGVATTTQNNSTAYRTDIKRCISVMDIQVQGLQNSHNRAGGIIGYLPTNALYTSSIVAITDCAVRGGNLILLNYDTPDTADDKVAVVNFGGIIGRMDSKYATITSTYTGICIDVSDLVINTGVAGASNAGMILGWSTNIDYVGGSVTNITNTYFTPSLGNAVEVAVGTAVTVLSETKLDATATTAQKVEKLGVDHFKEVSGHEYPELLNTACIVRVINIGIGETYTLPAFEHTYAAYAGYTTEEITVTTTSFVDTTTAGAYVVDYVAQFGLGTTAPKVYTKVIVVVA